MSSKVFQAGLEGPVIPSQEVRLEPYRVWLGAHESGPFSLQSVHRAMRHIETPCYVPTTKKSSSGVSTIPQNVLVHQQSTPDHPWDWKT